MHVSRGHCLFGASKHFALTGIRGAAAQRGESHSKPHGQHKATVLHNRTPQRRVSRSRRNTSSPAFLGGRAMLSAGVGGYCQTGTAVSIPLGVTRTTLPDLLNPVFSH